MTSRGGRRAPANAPGGSGGGAGRRAGTGAVGRAPARGRNTSRLLLPRRCPAAVMRVVYRQRARWRPPAGERWPPREETAGPGAAAEAAPGADASRRKSYAAAHRLTVPGGVLWDSSRDRLGGRGRGGATRPSSSGPRCSAWCSPASWSGTPSTPPRPPRPSPSGAAGAGRGLAPPDAPAVGARAPGGPLLVRRAGPDRGVPAPAHRQPVTVARGPAARPTLLARYPAR